MSNDAFIDYLRGLQAREDRGALAALRRGLGEPPGSVAEMHPHVARFFKRDDPRWTWHRQCLYIVAALFGRHPAPGGRGNLGDTFRAMADQEPGETPPSLELRLIALLKCRREDLFDHLRQAIGLAASRDVAVDYRQLRRDIERWESEDRWVQRNWARSFWGSGAAAPTDNETSAEGATS